MSNESDDLCIYPVQTVPDKELIDELVRRSLSSDRHGLILISARPKEGEPGVCDGLLAMASLDPALLAHFVTIIMKEANIQFRDNRVSVPPIRFKHQDKPYLVSCPIKPLSFEHLPDVQTWIHGVLEMQPIDQDGMKFRCHYPAAELLRICVERGYSCEPLSGARLLFSRVSSSVTLVYDPLPEPVLTIAYQPEE